MEIRWNLSGEEIERESFRAIEAECDLHAKLPAPEWRVARRLIHTTADPRIADTLVFRHDAVASGLKALRSGAPIFCDSKMIRSGLSLARLRRLNPGYGPERLHCHIDDPDVLARAKAEGRTRALCSAGKSPPFTRRGHRPHRQCPARAGPHRPLRAGRKCAPCPRRRNARGVRQCRRVQGPPCPLRRPPDYP